MLRADLVLRFLSSVGVFGSAMGLVDIGMGMGSEVMKVAVTGVGGAVRRGPPGTVGVGAAS